MVKVYKNSLINSISTFEISKQFNQKTIEEIINEYPAFNSAYLLQAVVLNKKKPEALKSKLTGIATKVLDRSLLHDYMHKNIFRFEKNKEEKGVSFNENKIETKEIIKDKPKNEISKNVETKVKKQEEKEFKNILKNTKEEKRDDAFTKLADDLFKDKIKADVSNLSEKEQRRISALKKLQEELFTSKKKEISKNKDLSKDKGKTQEKVNHNEFGKKEKVKADGLQNPISFNDINKKIATKKESNLHEIQALKEKILLQKQKEQKKKEEEFKNKTRAESLDLKKKIEEQKEKQQLKLQIQIRAERKRKEEERILLKEQEIKKAKDLKEKLKETERIEKLKEAQKLKEFEEKHLKETQEKNRLQEIEKEKTISNTNKKTSFLDWLKNKNKKVQEETTHEPKSIEKELDEIPFDKVSAIEAAMHQEIKNAKDPLDSFIGMQIAKKKNIKKQIQKTEQTKDKQSTLKGFASETFAEILIAQQKYNEAIEVYSSLSLKYPQKSIYFARQIEKIKTYL